MTKQIKNNSANYKSREVVSDANIKNNKNNIKQNKERENFEVDSSGYFVWAPTNKQK